MKKFFITIIFISTTLLPNSVWAQNPPAASGNNAQATIPQGGLLLFAMKCTCDANWLLTYFDFATMMPKWIVLTPASYISTPQNYEGFFQTGETYNLAGIVSGGVCMMYAGTACVNYSAPPPTHTFPPIPPGVGTSLSPL